MTKSKIILALLLIACFKTMAQDEQERNLQMIVHPQLFIPTSAVKETNGISVGGYISFERKVSDKIQCIVSVGGGALSGKKYTVFADVKESYPVISFAQIRTGAKYFFTGKLWVSGLVGMAHSARSDAGSWGFSYSPAIGYEIARKVDLSVRYDASSFKNYSINGIGINLGYHMWDF